MERIYLDYAATTPLSPQAAQAMRPWLEMEFGNPSSMYAEGRRARQAIDEARETIARRIGCDFGELVFTASGTEAGNLAIVGHAASSQGGTRKTILMPASEHHCVLHTTPWLERLGFRVEFLPVDRCGRVDLGALESALNVEVLLVCAMHANNELGTLQPVEQVSALCKRFGARFFCDAVQTLGAFSWDVEGLGADLAAFSAHKIGGPKGAGALYVRAGTRLKPLHVGGGQERELRAGTENVAGIVGFAAAADALSPDRDEKKQAARDAFLEELGRTSGAAWVRTVPADVECLSGHAHLRYPGISAESMLIRLDRMGVSASSGAACSSGSLEPSHVLLASGFNELEAKEGLRFTFGEEISIEQAADAARRVALAAETIRNNR